MTGGGVCNSEAKETQGIDAFKIAYGGCPCRRASLRT